MNKFSPTYLAGRDIVECNIYSMNVDNDNTIDKTDNDIKFLLKDIPLHTNAELISYTNEYISANYSVHSNKNSFFVRFITPKKHLSNGIGARIRLKGWKAGAVISIGYTSGKEIINIKARKIAFNNWFNIEFAYEDLAFRLTNDWIDNKEPDNIEDIRIVVVGSIEKENASLDIKTIYCWLEQRGLPGWLENFNQPLNSQIEAYSRLIDYFRFFFSQYHNHIQSYLTDGSCPLLYGKLAIEWSPYEAIPHQLKSSVTYRYTWHAWHPVTIMLLEYLEHQDMRLLFSARDFVNAWLDASYFTKDDDQKYCWYDHGVAERLLAMTLMWSCDAIIAFDYRFMARLRHAIYRHGQLLASEVFYAYTQNYRYHNHAWFQDLALLTIAICFQEMPCSRTWYTIARERLEDQIEHLIVRDGSYAVFIENSIGYQDGVCAILRLAGELFRIGGDGDHVSEVANELQKFQDFFIYPNGRFPSQGDTFRLPSDKNNIVKLSTTTSKDFCILPKAGYAIIKGTHDDCFYMFSILTTSLSQTHKHEDNLSFTLYFDSIEWLIDPSFYSHTYEDDIPKYLRSARAHNNIAIEDIKYSIRPGLTFLDGNIDNDQFYLTGKHTCYQDIQIEREVIGTTNKIEFTFTDKIKSNDSSIISHLMLHCGEYVNVEKKSSGIILSHPNSIYIMEITLPKYDIDIIFGDVNSGDLRGITGHEFMQVDSIYTIDVHLNDVREIKWSITAKKND